MEANRISDVVELITAFTNAKNNDEIGLLISQFPADILEFRQEWRSYDNWRFFFIIIEDLFERYQEEYEQQDKQLWERIDNIWYYVIAETRLDDIYEADKKDVVEKIKEYLNQ